VLFAPHGAEREARGGGFELADAARFRACGFLYFVLYVLKTFSAPSEPYGAGVSGRYGVQILGSIGAKPRFKVYKTPVYGAKPRFYPQVYTKSYLHQ
jgi:hypothetical protein